MENDVLIRCRQYKSDQDRVSLFRAYFHTSFLPESGRLEFRRPDLDGAASLPADLSLQLAFVPSAEEGDASKNAYWDAIGKLCAGRREKIVEHRRRVSGKLQCMPFVIEESDPAQQAKAERGEETAAPAEENKKRIVGDVGGDANEEEVEKMIARIESEVLKK